MPHLFATLKNVALEITQEVLEEDEAFHNSQGMYLEHLWQNADDENEVMFLFQIDDVEKTRTLIHKLHSDALAQDRESNLPSMIYLK